MKVKESVNYCIFSKTEYFCALVKEGKVLQYFTFVSLVFVSFVLFILFVKFVFITVNGSLIFHILKKIQYKFILFFIMLSSFSFMFRLS